MSGSKHWLEEYSLVELFAGRAWVTRTFRLGGLASASLDIDYASKLPKGAGHSMDLTTNAGMGPSIMVFIEGFLCFLVGCNDVHGVLGSLPKRGLAVEHRPHLGIIHEHIYLHICTYHRTIHPYRSRERERERELTEIERNYEQSRVHVHVPYVCMYINTCRLRLALATVLSGRMDRFLLVAGTVCSSFVPVNSGTHGRSLSDPLGRQDIPSVQLGNLLVCRYLGCLGRWRLSFPSRGCTHMGPSCI